MYSAQGCSHTQTMSLFSLVGYVTNSSMMDTYTQYTGCELTCTRANCDILDIIIRYSSLFKHIVCIEVNLKEREQRKIRVLQSIIACYKRLTIVKADYANILYTK